MSFVRALTHIMLTIRRDPARPIVNSCLADTHGDRKGALNRSSCLCVNKTAVDLQGKSGQPGRMGLCLGLFSFIGFELKEMYVTKGMRKQLNHTFKVHLERTGDSSFAQVTTNSQSLTWVQMQ